MAPERIVIGLPSSEKTPSAVENTGMVSVSFRRRPDRFSAGDGFIARRIGQLGRLHAVVHILHPHRNLQFEMIVLVIRLHARDIGRRIVERERLVEGAAGQPPVRRHGVAADEVRGLRLALVGLGKLG